MSVRDRVAGLHMNPIVQWADLVAMAGVLIALGVNWQTLQASDDAQKEALAAYETLTETKLDDVQEKLEDIEGDLLRYQDTQDSRAIRVEDKLDRLLERMAIHPPR